PSVIRSATLQGGTLNSATLSPPRHPERSEGSQRRLRDRPRNWRFVLARGLEDFLRGLRFERARSFSSRLISSRRFRAQPGLFTCRPRASASASAGTFSVSVEPAATYAPFPTRIGATSAVSLPIK